MSVQDGEPFKTITLIDLMAECVALLSAFLTMELIRRTIQVVKHGFSWNKLRENIHEIYRPLQILPLLGLFLLIANFGSIRAVCLSGYIWSLLGVTTFIYCLFFHCRGTLTILEKDTMRLEKKTNVGHVAAQSFYSMLVKSLVDPIGREAIKNHFLRHDIGYGLLSVSKFIFVPDLASDFYWPHLKLQNFNLAMMNGLMHVDEDEKELLDMPKPVTYVYNNNGKDRHCEYCVLKVKDLQKNRFVYLLYLDNRPLESIRNWKAEEMENLQLKYGKNIPPEIEEELRRELGKQVDNYFRSLKDLLKSESSLKGTYHVIKFGGPISEAVTSIVNLSKRIEEGFLPPMLNLTKENR